MLELITGFGLLSLGTIFGYLLACLMREAAKQDNDQGGSR